MKANLNQDFTIVGKTNALLSQIPKLLAGAVKSQCML